MEIERKFLLNPDINIWGILIKYPHDNIADYYFNETTRLRVVCDSNNQTKQLITIKSLGTLEREEYEYEIKPIINLPKPMLRKERYYIPYEGHTFEVNMYNSYFHVPELFHGKLALVEVELNNKDEEVILPPWIGQEVTDIHYFYNYNIFKFLKDDLV